MFKACLEFLVIVVGILLILTQIAIPMFTKLEFFWIFKKSSTKITPATEVIDQVAKDLKIKKKAVYESTKEVDSMINSLQSAKKQD